MRMRTTVFGLLGLAIALTSNQPRAWADFTLPPQDQGFSFVQTDWGPSNTSGNPLTFNKFNVPGATLTSVDLTFNWGFQNTITLSFGTPSTESVHASGGITLAKPNADITVNPVPGNFLFPTQTFSNVGAATGVAGQVISLPTQTFLSGNPNYTPAQHTTLSSASDLAPFIGSGTVGFQVVATATSDFTSSSGNGAGTSVTYAEPDLQITYHYVPEPSSVLLLGLGSGGLLLVYRQRRRTA